jgi:hypothetical protein
MKIIILLLSWMIPMQVRGVPPSSSRQSPEFPAAWRDIWKVASGKDPETILTITKDTIDGNEEILDMQSDHEHVSVMTVNKIKRCKICHIIFPLHPNVLAMQSSECIPQVSQKSKY